MLQAFENTILVLPMKTVSVITVCLLLLLAMAPASHACFDTYLFLQGKGMTYPQGILAFDGAGEYSIGELRGSRSDLFTGGFNLYYGVSRDFSIQALVSSSEKDRTTFRFDDFGLRGVYGLLSGYGGVYNLDVILEHHQSEGLQGGAYELSAPSIWHYKGFTYVLHPVAAFGRGTNLGMRGHGGVFHSTRNNTLIGVGAEYASAQSSAHLGKRLITGETGSSLFFGAMLTPNIFLQNELIKGWGAGSSEGDVGFAVTLKFLAPRGFRW